MEKEEFGKRSFVFGVAVDDYNFTDRKQETQQLCGNFESGINTILISPRRWGKTSLVKKAQSEEAILITYPLIFLDLL